MTPTTAFPWSGQMSLITSWEVQQTTRSLLIKGMESMSSSFPSWIHTTGEWPGGVGDRLVPGASVGTASSPGAQAHTRGEPSFPSPLQLLHKPEFPPTAQTVPRKSYEVLGDIRGHSLSDSCSEPMRGAGGAAAPTATHALALGGQDHPLLPQLGDGVQEPTWRYSGTLEAG